MRVIRVSALILLAGCGPLAVGLGVNELLDDDTAPDLGKTVLSLTENTPDSEALPPTLVNHLSTPLRVGRNRSDIKLRGLLLVGDPPVERDDDGCPVDRSLFDEDSPQRPDGVVPVSFDEDGVPDLPELPGDGSYELIALGASAVGEDCVSHRWTVDATRPPVPPDVAITQVTRTSVALAWRPVDDIGSGVKHYEVRYQLRTRSLAQQGSTRVAGTGARVNGTLQDSPASAGTATTVVLDQLPPCRRHWLAIRAVDFAGNASEWGIEISTRTSCGGNGRFTVAETIDLPPASGAQPVALTVADLDADNTLDVAAADGALDRVWVLLGSRDRDDLLGDPASFATGANGAGATSLVASDFDRDGVVDLAVGLGDSATSPLAFLRGQRPDGETPNGEFVAGAPFSVQGTADVTHLVLARVNLGAAPELLVQRATETRIELLSRDDLVAPTLPTRPTNANGARFPDFQHGLAAKRFAVADLNGDPLHDLMIPDSERLELRIIYGEQPPLSTDSSTPPKQLNGADYNYALWLTNGPGRTQELPAAGAPIGFVAGDFDADAAREIAIASDVTDAPGLLRVFERSSGGDYVWQRDQSLHAAPVAVGSGDFNGDGVLDVAIATTAGVEIFSGGDGGLVRHFEIELSDAPSDLAVADLDGDDILDLVIVSAAAARITVLLGEGEFAQTNGTFVLVDPPNSIGRVPVDLVVADFDQDGDQDVIVLRDDVLDKDTNRQLSPPSSLAFFLGRGFTQSNEPFLNRILTHPLAAQVSEKVPSDSLSYPADINGPSAALAAADMDDDGVLDLIVARTSSPDAEYGDPSDREFTTPWEFGVVTIIAGTGDAKLFAESTDEGFLEDDPMFAFANLSWLATGMAIVEINGDGLPDVVFGGTGRPIDVDPACVTGCGVGDGFGRELVIGQSRDSTNSKGGKGRLFNPKPTMALEGDVQESTSFQFRVADLDGDARPEIVSLAAKLDQKDGSPGAIQVRVRRNQTAVGELGAEANFSFLAGPLELPAGASPSAMALRDVDADGELDLIFADSARGVIEVWPGTGTLQRNEPTFAKSRAIVFDDFKGAKPTHMVMADFDRDGVLDIATANFEQDTVTILLGETTDGRANGRFRHHAVYTTGDGPMRLAATDLDGDRLIDLLVLHKGDRTLRVLLGNNLRE